MKEFCQAPGSGAQFALIFQRAGGGQGRFFALDLLEGGVERGAARPAESVFCEFCPIFQVPLEAARN